MDAGEPADGERGHGPGRGAPAAHRHAGSTTARTRCTPCLGEMYVSDERFTAFYDAMRPGLAEHLRDAIHANAARRRH